MRRTAGLDGDDTFGLDQRHALRERLRLERRHAGIGQYRAGLVVEEAGIAWRGQEIRQFAVEALGIEFVDGTARFAHGGGDGGELAGETEIDLAGEMQDLLSALPFEIAPAADRVQSEVYIEGVIIGDADAARTPGRRRRR